MGRSLRLGLVLVVSLAGACADFHRGPASDAALVDDPVFENDVYPILQSRCGDCHSPGGEAQASRFVLTGNAKADRAVVVMLVSPTDPDYSQLLLRATNAVAHTGGERLARDDPDYATIRSWIASLLVNH